MKIGDDVRAPHEREKYWRYWKDDYTVNGLWGVLMFFGYWSFAFCFRFEVLNYSVFWHAVYVIVCGVVSQFLCARYEMYRSGIAIVFILGYGSLFSLPLLGEFFAGGDVLRSLEKFSIDRHPATYYIIPCVALQLIVFVIFRMRYFSKQRRA